MNRASMHNETGIIFILLERLKIKYMNNITSYIHQWHPVKVDNKSKEEISLSKKNEDRLLNMQTIIRNQEGWGKLS